MSDRLEEQLKKMKPNTLSENEKATLWSAISYNIPSRSRAQDGKQPISFLSIIKITRMKFSIIPAALIALLVFGSVGTAAYADSSRPGDTLFPVDLATENARLFFSFGERKDELRLKFAQERVEEVREVVGSRFTQFTDLEDDDSASTTVEQTATSTDDSFETATSTNDNSQENKNDDDSENVSTESINQANNALTVAIDYLTKTREKMLAQGKEGAVATIDAMIAELTNIAENHIEKLEKVKTKIDTDDEDTKIKIEAKTDELKVKFKFDEKNGKNGKSKVEIDFDKKDKRDGDDDEDEDDDRDKDRDDDDDRDEKDHKIVICHKGETIEVAKAAYWAHKLHGDDKGACGDDDDRDDDEDDTTAPIIRDINIFTTTSVAEIEWRTNERTSGYVLYSTTTPVTNGNSNKTVSGDERDDDHDVRITGLPDNSTFYFLIVAKDQSGNVATSSEKSFKTKEAEDNTAPTISNLSLSKSTSTISVSWDTNEDAEGRVYIATTSPATSSNNIDSKITSGTSHSVLFSGLSPDTTYYVRVIAKDASGNETIENRTITTDEVVILDTTAPVISSLSVSSTTVSWTTDEAATSRVWYATTTPVSVDTASVKSNANLVTNHSITLDGINASTTVYYIVSSTDDSGNTATSSEQSFMTP